jgi:NDP-sugar pyrophosphorylase family protein
MKAMVLAAGLGTRLGALTANRPKALAEISGHTLLEITLLRLHSIGVRDVIINVHHLADMVIEYLKANNNFGLHVELSHEELLLDTGGGLKKASWFFLQDAAGTDEPFLLHNVDVLSNIDLQCMAAVHKERQALATLAVQGRESSRQLLFDERLYLCGRQVGQEREVVRPAKEVQPLAFSGIHVISPRFLRFLEGDGAFSIIDSYLRVAARGETILGFPAEQYYWRDLGRPDDLRQAAEDARNLSLI